MHQTAPSGSNSHSAKPAPFLVVPIPDSIYVQSPVRGVNPDEPHAECLHVWPRTANKRKIWRPLRWLRGLPLLSSHWEFDGWLGAVSPGTVAAYWQGNLAHDRIANADLDLLAAAVMFRAPALVPRMAGCGHMRGHFIGSCDVLPVAARVSPGVRLYLVRRVEPFLVWRQLSPERLAA